MTYDPNQKDNKDNQQQSGQPGEKSGQQGQQKNKTTDDSQKRPSQGGQDVEHDQQKQDQGQRRAS